MERWEAFAAALARHAVDGEVLRVVQSEYGTRHVVEGPLPSPDGRAPQGRSVWFLGGDAPTPRLVTAYAAKKARR